MTATTEIDVSLPADVWTAVLIQIQWERDEELRRATAAIREAVEASPNPNPSQRSNRP